MPRIDDHAKQGQEGGRVHHAPVPVLFPRTTRKPERRAFSAAVGTIRLDRRRAVVLRQVRVTHGHADVLMPSALRRQH